MLSDLQEHLEIVFVSLVLGALIAFPIGLIAFRWSKTYPSIIAVTQVLYTVPSLALFVLLINLVGLGQQPVIIGLTIYSLVILVRNLVEGLRGVPPEVTDAATAMGYRETRRLFAVELPLALPAIVAGLRRRRGLGHLARQRRRADRHGRPRPALHPWLPDRQPDRDLDRDHPHGRARARRRPADRRRRAPAHAVDAGGRV